tara:strand:- start:2027 stop:2479 length:453 start_codon:yes stop_codon:yes gene_type:complete
MVFSPLNPHARLGFGFLGGRAGENFHLQFPPSLRHSGSNAAKRSAKSLQNGSSSTARLHGVIKRIRSNPFEFARELLVEPPFSILVFHGEEEVGAVQIDADVVFVHVVFFRLMFIGVGSFAFAEPGSRVNPAGEHVWLKSSAGIRYSIVN